MPLTLTKCRGTLNNVYTNLENYETHVDLWLLFRYRKLIEKLKVVFIKTIL